MSSIYVHIPFCKSRCIYCDFYSTTLGEARDRYIDAVLKDGWRCGDIMQGGGKLVGCREMGRLIREKIEQ